MAPLTRARALLPGWRAVVVCMLVGVLMAFAVSWTLAVGYGRVGGWKLTRGTTRWLALSDDHARRVREFYDPSEVTPIRELAWPIGVPTGWSAPRVRSVRGGIGYHRVSTARGGEPLNDYAIRSCLSGLPFKGLRTDHLTEDYRLVRSNPWQSGIPLDNGASLPVRPIWPAFLANTAFYAMLTWAAALGVRTLRNRIRLKPGQCPHCRYDATGLTQCPECGTFLVVKKEQCNE